MYLAGELGGSADAVNAYAASSFYAVDRYASYKRFWQADYEAGALIVAARYATSNAIHQMAKLPPEEWDGYLAWLEDYEYRLLGLPRPDDVVFLDMPLDVAQRLLSAGTRGTKRKRTSTRGTACTWRRCRQTALYAAERGGWHVIPCGREGKPLPPEDITRALIAALALE